MREYNVMEKNLKKTRTKCIPGQLNAVICFKYYHVDSRTGCPKKYGVMI